MSRTTHVCAGCGAELSAKRHLQKEVGTVRASWNCAHCGTKVPAIVAEKIRHQTQY